MGGVDLFDQEISHLVGVITLDLVNISAVDLHEIYKVLYPKEIQLLNCEIVLVKSMIATYNSCSQSTPVNHVSRREVLQSSVPLHFNSHFFKDR